MHYRTGNKIPPSSYHDRRVKIESRKGPSSPLPLSPLLSPTNSAACKCEWERENRTRANDGWISPPFFGSLPLLIQLGREGEERWILWLKRETGRGILLRPLCFPVRLLLLLPPFPGDLPLRDEGGEVKASGWQRACHCYVSSTD